MWPTGVSLATVWASWLLMECLKQVFLPLPTPPYPTPPYIPCTPSISNTDGKKEGKKYHEIQPSEIEKVGILWLNTQAQYKAEVFLILQNGISQNTTRCKQDWLLLGGSHVMMLFPEWATTYYNPLQLLIQVS